MSFEISHSSLSPVSTAAPHPEEMNASVDFQLGNYASFRASARATPAGFVTAAILFASIAATSALIYRWRTAPRMI